MHGTAISSQAKPSINDQFLLCIPVQVFTHRLFQSATTLPPSLCITLHLTLPFPRCALLKQITLYRYLCKRALWSQLCPRVEKLEPCRFKMRKESRWIRWIKWLVIVTALFLLGFCIGKRVNPTLALSVYCLRAFLFLFNEVSNGIGGTTA